MPYHISGSKRDPRVPIKHTEILEHLDGDPKKVTLVDESSDRRWPVNFALGISGRPVDATHMPTRLRRKGNKGLPMHDVGNICGGLRVTEKFKDVVESFEPGVHQSFPYRLSRVGR